MKKNSYPKGTWTESSFQMVNTERKDASSLKELQTEQVSNKGGIAKC